MRAEESERQLTALLRLQASELEAWQVAELHLLERACRSRLAELGVPATPDVALALMAVATLLIQHAPEWGGDARDALGEVGLVGLRLLDRPA